MLLSVKGVGQITIQSGPYNFIYNGSNQFPIHTKTCSGLNFVASTRFLDALNANVNPKNAGSYTMIVELTGDCVEQQSVSFTINKATPTITATGATTYTYNGTPQGPGTSTYPADATGAVTYSYSGAASDGTVYSASGTMPTNAGSYQVVASIASDVNYNSASSVATSFTINKKPLTITIDASDKVYDGITYANPTITSDQLGSDIIVIYSSSAFDNKNIGIGKAVTTSITSITGTDAGNYSLTSATATGTASITVKSLTVSATASDKVYDGTNIATASLTNNKISGDDLTVNKTGVTFDNKNIGTGKAVTVAGITLTGTDAGNYTLTSATASGTASITVKSLTITATVSDKVYDGNATATATLTDNKISGDDLTVNKTGAIFNNKNIGVGKTVTVSGISITGTDAGNYTLTSATATGTASITVKSLTISATASDKVYDGNTTATATLTDNKISGDDLTVNKTGATFNNKNIGVGKAVTVSGISITGTDAGNYTLTSATATGTASITVKSLTISATASDKVYDANKTANVNLSSNKLGSDVVTITKTLAEFDTKDVGTGKTVNVTGITISGTDAGSYTLTSATATGTASITAKILTITAKPHTILYNGTNYSGGNGVNLTEMASGESISNLTGTLNYIGTSQGTKDIGSYTIIPDGLSSPNYNIVYVGDNLEIKKATLKVIAGNQSVNFGTPAAKILTDATFTYASLLGGDNASAITGSLSYSTNYTPLTSTGSTGIYIEPIISGLSAANYNLIAEKGNITITASPSSPVFQIPNAFTPNSDGHNDTFKIIQNGYVTSIISFRVFTKSGKLIFSDKDGAWDGRYGGVMLDADVYIWIADFINKNNVTEHLSGTVLLLK
jgi:gliding motility-associated-like protein